MGRGWVGSHGPGARDALTCLDEYALTSYVSIVAVGGADWRSTGGMWVFPWVTLLVR